MSQNMQQRAYSEMQASLEWENIACYFAILRISAIQYMTTRAE